MCEFFYQERKDHSLTSRQEPPVNYGHYKVFVLTMDLFFLVYSRSSWKFRKYHDSLPIVSIILYYLFEIFFVFSFMVLYFYFIICHLWTLLFFIKCSKNGNRDAWTWCSFDGWQTGKEVKDITAFMFLEVRKKDFWKTSVLPGKYAQLLALHFKCYGTMIRCSDKATLKYIINDLVPSF